MLKKMLRLLILMTYLSLFLVIATTHGRPLDGSCALYNFSSVMVDGSGTIDTNQGVWVLRHDAPVYPKADSSKPTSTKLDKLEFGDYLLPVKVAKHPDKDVLRVQVKKIEKTKTATIGWMDGYDLLCGVSPLQSEKGLDRKVFVKTPSRRDPRMSTVDAYPSYEGPCSGHCKQLSRFQLYFIFAEDKLHRRYFILKAHKLKDKPLSSLPQAGWVKYDNTILWDTTLGLRPKDEVDKISAYKLPGDINNPERKTGVEVAGGNIWYTYPIHIPILDINKEQNYYHAAASSIGVGLHEGVLSSFKLVDVFFLLDGTASMGPYIEAAGQAAQDIVKNLRNEPQFKETSFRFGFRVYRDTYADEIMEDCYGGVCEGMPLSTETCLSDQKASDANWTEFKDKIDQVKETRNEKDDYPEKLFDGLYKAMLDMAPCPKRTKLLFVIGDNGDRQNEWPPEIVNGLKGLADRTLVFFIQTPNNSSQVRTPRLYQQAYDDYGEQAIKLLNEIILPHESINPADYFLSLNQTQLTTQIVEKVKQYSPGDVVNEIEQALAGGKSVQEIIEEKMAEGDMPVMYWKWVRDTACPKLGQQCETPVEHGVVDFYIPIDGTKIQEEVWMTMAHLNDWLSLLKPFKNIKALPVRTQREIFVRLLRKQIQEMIGGYPRGDITLSEWLAGQRKQVLPMRQDSPLLQYSFDEIRREIEGCEVSLLVNWMVEIRKVLQKVYNDSTKKVAFTPKYPTSISCPLSEKGQKVPELLEFKGSESLGPDDSYRYDHNLYGQTVYWLPIEFLP
jgi:hypothetical protein